jgi:hypothetical protein
VPAGDLTNQKSLSCSGASIDFVSLSSILLAKFRTRHDQDFGRWSLNADCGMLNSEATEASTISEMGLR